MRHSDNADQAGTHAPSSPLRPEVEKRFAAHDREAQEHAARQSDVDTKNE